MKRIAPLLLLALATLVPVVPALAQPNLTSYQFGTWSFPLVPKSVLHTPPYVWLDPVLDGNEETTYWNAAGINNGDTAINSPFYIHLWVDGVNLYGPGWLSIPAGSQLVAADQGPILVRGGRHTLAVRWDGGEALAETDETDNVWGRQFVWTPLPLENAGAVVRNEPPDPAGGWDGLTIAPRAHNCDGFTFTSDTPWTAIALRGSLTDADYDLRLYDVPANWDDGFISVLTASSLGGGQLDAMLVNGNQLGVVDYNVGVEKYEGTGDFVIEEVENSYISVGDVLPTMMDYGDVLKIWQLDIGGGDTGPLLLAADAVPGSLLHLFVFDASFTMGNLTGAAATGSSEGDGTLRLVHDFAVPGSYAVVVTREPGASQSPLDFTLVVSESPVDLEPAHATGWHAPLVPRPLADGTPVWVPLPASLTGWSANTYFNLAITNNGPSPIQGVQTLSYMDGAKYGPGYSFPMAFLDYLPAGGVALLNNFSPLTIPGGRHTWTCEVDPYDNVLEISEANNWWGEQYVWAPSVLTYQTQIYGTVDGLANGGLTTITSGEIVEFNCNGYRLSQGSGYWNAVAISHDPDNDLDLTLHPPSIGPKDGFGTELGSSIYSLDSTDFVVVNRNVIGSGDVDLGVVRWAGESGNYGLDVRESTIIYDITTTPIGPAVLADGEMIQIYDVWLEAGPYSFLLDNVSGSVDWGFQLMPHDLSYMGRHQAVPGAVAFDNGSGSNEYFDCLIADAGWYGLVVYKSKVTDRLLTGSYRIQVGFGGTPVENGTLPALTAISGIRPNPFNPSTEIAFELDTPGPVRLEVYDLKGSLVRTLVSSHMDAGPHRTKWNGLDRNGRAVPSGVYLARLRANQVDLMEKMVMLK